MDPTHRERRRRAPLELLAQVVWMVGAFASYFAGATFHAVAGLGVLLATFCLTLLVAVLAIGWGAVPRVIAALLLQAPLLVGLGVYALSLPLGHDPFPCFFWDGTALQQLEAFTVVAALSAPFGFLLRLERPGVERLRWFARRAAPLATLLAAGLAALGAVRLARFPTPDHYIESLPLHATIPSPRGQPCAPIEDTRDPAHDPGWRHAECATPDFDARPVSFHFHADASTDDPGYYSLHFRSKDGRDHYALGLSRSKLTDLPVRRDDSLDVFFVQREGRPGVVSSDGWRWRVSIFEIRKRVAPPLGFWIATLAGLVFALACFGASAALGDVAPGDGKPGEAWIAARRGDASLAALAAVLCSSALLVAALVAGFLF
jgi:hypothetical protein